MRAKENNLRRLQRRDNAPPKLINSLTDLIFVLYLHGLGSSVHESALRVTADGGQRTAVGWLPGSGDDDPNEPSSPDSIGNFRMVASSSEYGETAVGRPPTAVQTPCRRKPLFSRRSRKRSPESDPFSGRLTSDRRPRSFDLNGRGQPDPSFIPRTLGEPGRRDDRRVVPRRSTARLRPSDPTQNASTKRGPALSPQSVHRWLLSH